MMMAVKVMKANKFSWQQERNFVITNKNIYNFKKKQLRRVIMIKFLSGVTKNLSKASSEFVIHVENQPDYRISCEKRNEFIDTLKLAYITLRKDNLKIFGIPKTKSLVDFVTTERDIQKGKTRMPLALSRLTDEDLMSDAEVREAQVELRLNGMSIESPSSKITIDMNNMDQQDISVNIEHK